MLSESETVEELIHETDAYKRVESTIRELATGNLIQCNELRPVNLVPLGGAESVPWREDLESIFGSFENAPIQLLTSINEDAVRHVELEYFPLWMKSRDVFELKEHPGVYLIPQAFPEPFLQELGHKCRSEYPYLPETNTNLGQLLDRNATLFHRKPRLRWISLGCDYDWTQRVYRSRKLLPAELAEKAKDIANMFGLWPTYKPDCALVNYYGWSDRLRGHTDDVEEAMEMPLITISLGQSGIFLMGGHTRQTKPDAIILRHGDCCIMSQDSRKDFHGVPRLLYYKQNSTRGAHFPQHTQRFSQNLLNDYRINISVRQCWR